MVVRTSYFLNIDYLGRLLKNIGNNLLYQAYKLNDITVYPMIKVLKVLFGSYYYRVFFSMINYDIKSPVLTMIPY